MSRYQSAADILAEDALRRRQLELPVDPVTGLNAGGSRFLLRLPDCRLSVQYLHAPMRTLPLIVRLS